MMTNNNAVSILKQELAFLDRGGYRTPIGSRQPLFCMETSVEWRHRLFFEDSPTCPKKRYCACNPESDCVLKDFVPVKYRHETVPCRHIPLNEDGETIDSLYRTGTNSEIEAALRNWLIETIQGLEEQISVLPQLELEKAFLR